MSELALQFQAGDLVLVERIGQRLLLTLNAPEKRYALSPVINCGLLRPVGRAKPWHDQQDRSAGRYHLPVGNIDDQGAEPRREISQKLEGGEDHEGSRAGKTGDRF